MQLSPPQEQSVHAHCDIRIPRSRIPAGDKSIVQDKGRLAGGAPSKNFCRDGAQVGTPHEGLWNVPYGALTHAAPATAPAMPLKEVEVIGLRLIRKHQSMNGLKKGWKFGFDLAPVRGGVCRYKEKADRAFRGILPEGIPGGDCGYHSARDCPRHHRAESWTR